MLSHFDTILERDRQTDGRTDRRTDCYIIIARVLYSTANGVIRRRNDAIWIYIRHHACDRLSRDMHTWAHLPMMTLPRDVTAGYDSDR